ncbi:Major facilitator superfamily domain containing protein [Amanita muscaria]
MRVLDKMNHGPAEVTAVDSPGFSLTVIASPSLCRQNDSGITSQLSSRDSLGDNPHPKALATVSANDLKMVTWDGPDDPQNPQNWSNQTKWMTAVVAIIMTINVSYASAAPAITSPFLAKQFGVSAEVSYLVTSTFLFGYAFGPLFWGPGSELIGRRPIFIIAMISFTLSHLGQGLGNNIETVLVTRFFSGFFAAAPLTNCGGLMADMFSAESRGIAMNLLGACIFLGPVFGAIISGFTVENGLGWRWVYWITMIFTGACTLAVILLIRETYAPVILLKKAQRLRKADPVGNAKLYAEQDKQDWSFYGVIKRTIFRPFKMLSMEPILLLVTIYMSMVYGLMYALLEVFPIIFMQKRGFTAGQDGLVFIGFGIGTTVGSIINTYLSRHYPALIKKWKGFPPPEERLLGAMLGAPILVIGSFWLGWTGEYESVPWYIPALSTILLGMSICLIFMSFLNYLVDTYLVFSASAFAANTVIRSTVASAFPLFTVKMFQNLHVNWAATLIGLLALLFAPCPFLFYKYGTLIRQKSRFAPCMDLKIAKQLEAEKLLVGGTEKV